MDNVSLVIETDQTTASVLVNGDTSLVDLSVYDSPSLVSLTVDAFVGGSSGVTYVQDSVPSLGAQGQTWYNPLTQQLKVFNDGAWSPVAPDGGYF